MKFERGGVHMLQFLSENWGTVFIGAATAAVVVLVILKMRRDKKRGKSGCGCGCAGCPAGESCHRKEKQSKR